MDNLLENTFLQNGKYRIIKFLGSGGFGITYLAEHVLLGKRICIKEFFPSELCNRDCQGIVHVGTDKQVEFVNKLRNKFINEARILNKFTDIDGIVKVSDVFSENETAYYVMDYIEGYNLDDYIAKNGCLSESEAVDIITQTGSALSDVHNRNCLHLDVKPANIMISAGGKPILIDFGVAKQYDSESYNTSTLVGFTRGYAPLEQQSGSITKFSPATDVYSLAATLYTLVTGKIPPGAADRLNGVELELPDNLSLNVRIAIHKGMSIAKKDRPQTVNEFIELLVQSVSLPDINPNPAPPFHSSQQTPAEIDIDSLLSSFVAKNLTFENVKKRKGLFVKIAAYLFVSISFLCLYYAVDPWNKYVQSVAGVADVDDLGYNIYQDDSNRQLVLTYNNQDIDKFSVDSLIAIDKQKFESPIAYQDVVEGVEGDEDSNYYSFYLNDKDEYGYAILELSENYGLYRNGKKILPVKYSYILVLGENTIRVTDENDNSFYIDGSGNNIEPDIVAYDFDYGWSIDFGIMIIGLLAANLIVFIFFKIRTRSNKTVKGPLKTKKINEGVSN